MARGGNGKGIAFIRAHVGHAEDACLPWPGPTPNGYGVLGHLGKIHYAHRFMCELAHGPGPDGYEAAHECGNSQCVNPRHLRWKTPSENQFDRVRHGRGPYGPRGKVTLEQADEIRALRGIVTQEEIAKRYGITRSAVCHIMLGKRRSRTRIRAAA